MSTPATKSGLLSAMRLVRSALFAPIYWVLMSIGAWKAALQLVVRPHYWEKTTHGLSDAAAPRRDGSDHGGE